MAAAPEQTKRGVDKDVIGIPESDASSAKESDAGSAKIDPAAPAGSEKSLGAESVRDGRPATDDKIVEAIDEEGPGVTKPLAIDKGEISD
jgi:hypothetical protein